MAASRLPIFDGHNDVLIRLDDGTRDFFQHGSVGHIDLPRADEGGLGGGFCAIFTESDESWMTNSRPPTTAKALADGYFPGPVERDVALRRTIEIMARLSRIEDESVGRLKIVRTACEIEQCLRDRVFAALMHVEGAEAIDPELHTLEVFQRAGLRSLGLVWSRRNAFGDGVPFQFAHDPDTGPGLTEAGRALVQGCNRLRILVDVSHLNEKGFWDVAAVTDAPIVATHSNAWSLSRATRNLTDKQLDAIRESDGMVGVNFAAGFLREDGFSQVDTPLTAIVRHVDYLVARIGIDRVGFGSDFDGAEIPRELGDAAGLPRLIEALQDAGYDEPALRKLAHENWIRVLRRTWGD